jgi:hypothetical protein
MKLIRIFLLMTVFISTPVAIRQETTSADGVSGAILTPAGCACG